MGYSKIWFRKLGEPIRTACLQAKMDPVFEISKNEIKSEEHAQEISLQNQTYWKASKFL